MAPVRVARAFRLPMIVAVTALGLSGCMHTSGPVATVQPRSDLDAMAYGEPYPYSAAPRGAVAAPYVADGGGAISALRASFASPRPRYYPPGPAAAPVPVAYAAAPTPVAYDS